jgi:hypothetical protein
MMKILHRDKKALWIPISPSMSKCAICSPNDEFSKVIGRILLCVFVYFLFSMASWEQPSCDFARQGPRTQWNLRSDWEYHISPVNVSSLNIDYYAIEL